MQSSPGERAAAANGNGGSNLNACITDCMISQQRVDVEANDVVLILGLPQSGKKEVEAWNQHRFIEQLYRFMARLVW